jgi:hypothetical protein
MHSDIGIKSNRQKQVFLKARSLFWHVKAPKMAPPVQETQFELKGLVLPWFLMLEKGAPSNKACSWRPTLTQRQTVQSTAS